jgi:hypothetical protein
MLQQALRLKPGGVGAVEVGIGVGGTGVGVAGTAAIPTTGTVIPTVVEAGVVSGSESGKRVTSQAVAAVVICC